MTKIFALLAVLLILTGAVLMAVPKASAPAGPGLAPEAAQVTTVVAQMREIAEQVNAPLSILFGLVSLFYSRRSYVVNLDRAAKDKGGRA